jgi:hypothetical protein
MREAERTTADVLGGVGGSGDRPVAINALFPWDSGTRLPAVLTEALPTLPASLEFRLVGTTLVLVDLDADLILDVLSNALPDLNPIAAWEVRGDSLRQLGFRSDDAVSPGPRDASHEVRGVK